MQLPMHQAPKCGAQPGAGARVDRQRCPTADRDVYFRFSQASLIDCVGPFGFTEAFALLWMRFIFRRAHAGAD
jgi:hypothetical protein